MRKLGYLVVLALLAACQDKEPPISAPAPRPVTVIKLKELDPVEPLLLTGSVESWKDQAVSFEVEGRLEFIVEAGTYLEGRWEEDGGVTVEGDVLARLDSRTYEIGRDQARASVEVAKERLDAAVVELEQVLPANVKAAEARLARADAEYRSTKAAFEKQAMTEIDFVRATADLDTKRAELDQAKAAIETKKADIQALKAQVRNREEDLRQAEYDLSRCTLYAPFSGEVSEVNIEAGGYARRGQAVAHLVMMNPIKVDLAVSAQTAAKLRRGDIVKLYVPGVEEPKPASVYEKATVADPETRTFRISVITRNIRQQTPFPADDPRAKLPIVRDTMPLMTAHYSDVLAVEGRRCLREDAQGHYVWADPTRVFGDSLPDGTVLKLRKFRVTPGERRVSFQGLYVMREVIDAGDLRPGTLLPLDPPETDAEEQEVVIAKSQWLLQPGQLVPVLLEDKAPLHGIYVPMNTIEVTGENRGAVFLVRDGKAKRIEVEVLGQVRDLVHVRGEGLDAGSELIADYIHFLEDGEEVRVIRRRELNS